MSIELEASKLISKSFDQELTDIEVAQLNRLLEESPGARNVKCVFDTVRQIAQSPPSFESNGVMGNETLSSEMQDRIQNAINAELSKTAGRQPIRVSRQLRDVAFASVLLSEGRLTEGELVDAVGDWTAFGSEPLVDHLTQSKLLRDEEAAEYESMSGQALIETATSDETIATETGPKESIFDDSETLLKTVNILGLGHVAANELQEESRRVGAEYKLCLLYTSPSPRDATLSRMPSSA